VRDWKQAERRIAEILGGRRIPVSGRGRGDAPDIEHPTLSVEVKARASFPAWLEDALRQAELSAVEGRIPIAVLHPDRRRYSEALVVLRLAQFAELIGGPGRNVATQKRKRGP
jgi:hypothetical protein